MYGSKFALKDAILIHARFMLIVLLCFCGYLRIRELGLLTNKLTYTHTQVSIIYSGCKLYMHIEMEIK